ncbi:MAG: hydrogenase maturation nickel metallochaperone HypA [candidate division WOR-3 bacterium]
MHEYSLANNLIELLREQKKEKKAKKILKVELDFGKLSGAEPVLFEEAFEILKKETEFKETELKINLIEPEIKCLKCGKTFNTPYFPFLCPFCENFGGEIIKGDKIFIKSLVIENF